MSFEIVYKRLYSLGVANDFFKDEECNDFRFVPLRGTRETLRSLGIIFKENKKGFDLIYRTDGSGFSPYFAIEGTRVINFGIQLVNDEALSYTDLPEKQNASQIYFLEGAYDDASPTVDLIDTRPMIFTESKLFPSKEATFRIEDVNANQLLEWTQEGLQDDDNPTHYHHTFSADLGAYERLKRVTLKTLINGSLEESTDVLIYNAMIEPAIIGIFSLTLDKDIVYDSSLPYSSEVELAASSSIWKYSIELTRDFTNGNFAVNNTGGGGLTFSEIAPPADYLKGRTVVFQSSDPIAKSELANKDFDLVVTSDDIDLTISPLPNPSPYSTNSTIYLKI